MNWKITTSDGQTVEVPATPGEALGLSIDAPDLTDPPPPPPDPIDCVVSSFGVPFEVSPWTPDASGTTETRKLRHERTVVQVPSLDGKECPVLFEEWTETRDIPKPPTVPEPSTTRLPTVADLKYLGYRDVQTNGNNTSFAQGLALHYVNGEPEPRLLITQHVTWANGVPNTQPLHEISLAGVPYGGKVTKATAKWDGISRRAYIGLHFDPESNRLFTTATDSYQATVIPTQIFAHELPDGGGSAVSHGPVSLQGVSAKSVFGGCFRAPAWWTEKYPEFPFWCGFGGGTSLVRQGGAASLGPTLYAIPDPLSVPPQTEVPIGKFMIVMDCESGTMAGTDGYAEMRAGLPAKFDRGVRMPDVENYFDGGIPGPQPLGPLLDTRPKTPPAAGARWLSPAPDGLGRWTWGETYYQTACWIETPTVRGLAMLLTVSRGKAWYANATLNADEMGTELHVYAEQDILDAAAGKIQPFLVRPRVIERIDFEGMEVYNPPGLGSPANPGVNVTRGKVAAMQFDPKRKRLYVCGFRNFFTRVYEFEVRA